MLGTLDKAGAVLDLYSTERPEWGPTEVARHLGMPVSSAHGLLASLAQMGLLHRTVAGRYRLGFKLLSLSHVLLSNTPWRDVAHEEMTAAFRRGGGALLLAALDGTQVVTVSRVDAPRAGGASGPRVGTALPVDGAPARVLLAHRPWPVARRALLAAGLGADVQDAPEVLAAVRAAGVAVREDTAADVWAVAAPVRNHNGEVIAAVACTVDRAGPHADAARRSAEAQVRALGQAISGRIGYVEGMSEEGRLVWLSVGGRERLRGVARRAPGGHRGGRS